MQDAFVQIALFFKALADLSPVEAFLLFGAVSGVGLVLLYRPLIGLREDMRPGDLWGFAFPSVILFAAYKPRLILESGEPEILYRMKDGFAPPGTRPILNEFNWEEWVELEKRRGPSRLDKQFYEGPEYQKYIDEDRSLAVADDQQRPLTFEQERALFLQKVRQLRTLRYDA